MGQAVKPGRRASSPVELHQPASSNHLLGPAVGLSAAAAAAAAAAGGIRLMWRAYPCDAREVMGESMNGGDAVLASSDTVLVAA
eukprot:1157669-Pelagomonas_calceolata.AAC.2